MTIPVSTDFRAERCPVCQRMVPVKNSGKFKAHRQVFGVSGDCPNSGQPSGRRDLRQPGVSIPGSMTGRVKR